MQNDKNEIVDLYIPRKCSATNHLITAYDFKSVQIEIADVSAFHYTIYSTLTSFCVTFWMLYRSTVRDISAERREQSLSLDWWDKEESQMPALTDFSAKWEWSLSRSETTQTFEVVSCSNLIEQHLKNWGACAGLELNIGC